MASVTMGGIAGGGFKIYLSGVDEVDDGVERELPFSPALLDLTVASNGSL